MKPKHPATKGKKCNENIRVCLRVRPLHSSEIQTGQRSIIDNLDNQVYLRHLKKTRCFAFDEVFDEGHRQADIFKSLGKGMVEQFVEGYNCTVFAYGQTGAGKTYTMQGELKDEDKRGLMPRSLDYFFFLLGERMAKMKSGGMETDETQGAGNACAIVKLTLVEIYNEVIYDLLSDNGSTQLRMREDINKGVFLEGITESVCGSFYEAQRVITTGLKRRHVGSTHANSESSRSHSVVTVHFESRLEEGGLGAAGSRGPSSFQYSKFNFVDLAGSERQKRTKARGKRLREGCNINKSLTILGSVIYSLAERRKNNFVRYRDSKLTFLLKDSLGGNSNTVFIANVSPSVRYYVETLSTLLFAQRAKMIKNKAVINQDIRGGDVESLRHQLTEAKTALANLRRKYQVLEENQAQALEVKSLTESCDRKGDRADEEQETEGIKTGGRWRENGTRTEVETKLREKVTVLKRSVGERYAIMSQTLKEVIKRVRNVLKPKESREEIKAEHLAKIYETPQSESKMMVKRLREPGSEKLVPKNEEMPSGAAKVQRSLGLCGISEFRLMKGLSEAFEENSESELAKNLSKLNMDELTEVLKRGFEEIGKYRAFLDNTQDPNKEETKEENKSNIKIEEELTTPANIHENEQGNKRREEFLERIMLEEEAERLRKRVRALKDSARISSEKMNIMKLWSKDIIKEKQILARQLDQKTFEKFQSMNRFEEDYERTKLQNIRLLDEVDDLQSKKEGAEDALQLFTDENERLGGRIKELYNQKIEWFQERDQMLGLLDRLDQQRVEKIEKMLEAVGGGGEVEGLKEGARAIREILERERVQKGGVMRGGNFGSGRLLRTENHKLRPQRPNNANQENHPGISNIITNSNQVSYNTQKDQPHDDIQTNKQNDTQTFKWASKRRCETCFLNDPSGLESKLKQVKSSQLTKSLSIRNLALSRENQKYFDFVNELRQQMGLSERTTLERLVNLIEANVDSVLVRRKLQRSQSYLRTIEQQNLLLRNAIKKNLDLIQENAGKGALARSKLIGKLQIVCAENRGLRSDVWKMGWAVSGVMERLAENGRLLCEIRKLAIQDLGESKRSMDPKYWESVRMQIRADLGGVKGAKRKGRIMDRMEEDAGEDYRKRIEQVKQKLRGYVEGEAALDSHHQHHNDHCQYDNHAEKNRESMILPKGDTHMGALGLWGKGSEMTEGLGLSAESLLEGALCLWRESVSDRRMRKERNMILRSENTSLMGKREAPVLSTLN